MPEISSVAPQFSASRDGGEQVEITGSGLDAVTAVGFGPFAAAVVAQEEGRLVVTAPAYMPGHGGDHGEVIVWVDAEPTRTGVVWTWSGRTLEELGGPMDAVDQAVGLGSWSGSTGDPADPVDRAVAEAAANAPKEAAPELPHQISEDTWLHSFEPQVVPAEGGWITLRGEGFHHVVQVTISNDLPCPEFRIVSDQEIQALVPAFPAGHTSEHWWGPLVKTRRGDGGVQGAAAGGANVLYWEVDGALQRIHDPREGNDVVVRILDAQPRDVSLDGGTEVLLTGEGLTDVQVTSVSLGPWFFIDDVTNGPDGVRFRVPAWSSHTYRLHPGEPLGPVHLHIGIDGSTETVGSNIELTFGGRTIEDLVTEDHLRAGT
jgi:hypothetical protein